MFDAGPISRRLDSLDALFVRSLVWLHPRVRGDACVADCHSTHFCQGGCQCPGQPVWCTGFYLCDDCGGQLCDTGCHGCPAPGSPC